MSKVVERFFLQRLSVRGSMNMPNSYPYFNIAPFAFLEGLDFYAFFGQKRRLHPAYVLRRRIRELFGDSGASAFFVARLCCATFYLWEEQTMPNYEQLYHLMVNASEKALAALENGNVWDAKRILVEVEREAEERYIENAR